MTLGEIRADTPAVVLGLQPDELAHGWLGIARSLGRLGVTVDVLRAGPAGPAASSRYVRRVVELDAGASEDRVLSELEAMAANAREPPALFFTDDVSAIFASDHETRLAQAFRLPRQPPGLARRLTSKKEMHLLTEELGISGPRTQFPEAREDVEAFLETSAFPLVLKAIRGDRLVRRAGVTMRIVGDADDALRAYAELEDPREPNLMLQEYIPGGSESVWMLNGYFDAGGRMLVGFTGRKLRQYPTYGGMSSLAICLPNPTVEETTRRLAAETGYRGVIDIGYRFDRRDGRHKVLDINPRIGSTFRLFTAGNGMDVARAAYLDLTGQPVPPSCVRPGRRWVVESHDLASCVRHWRDGELTLRDWTRSYRGVEEGAWFARDDPQPLLAMCGRVPLRLARRRRVRGGATAGP